MWIAEYKKAYGKGIKFAEKKFERFQLTQTFSPSAVDEKKERCLRNRKQIGKRLK
jgi:hypothetical protein